MEPIKFDTYEQAQEFADKVNEAFSKSLPKDSVTNKYCEPFEVESEWFVVNDEYTTKFI